MDLLSGKDTGVYSNMQLLHWLTSRHDMTHILNGESRVFVLCVYPDHTMTQPTH